MKTKILFGPLCLAFLTIKFPKQTIIIEYILLKLMIVAHFNIDYLKTNDLNLINANDGATYFEKSLDLKHPLTIGTIIIEKFFYQTIP